MNVTERAPLEPPDLDAIEALSAELHAIYQSEARRQSETGDDTVRHPDDYDALPEHTKEYDRVLAQFILERERAQEQIDLKYRIIIADQRGKLDEQERRIAELEREREPHNADDPFETLVLTSRLQSWLRQINEQQSEIDRLLELLREAHDWLRGPLSPGAFAVDLYGRIAVALAEPPK